MSPGTAEERSSGLAGEDAGLTAKFCRFVRRSLNGLLAHGKESNRW